MPEQPVPAPVPARAASVTGPAKVAEPAAQPEEGLRRRAIDALRGVLGTAAWPVAIYCGSRLLLLVVAEIAATMGHHSIGPEFFRFDGQWYLKLASHGYPHEALHAKSTLGFFPLYSLVTRLVAWGFFTSVARAALITTIAGGLVAAILAHRLSTAWWGEQAGRRATVVFCLFPGSIVFSMAYSECLAIPLAIGCVLALRSRRWVLAGVLAAVAGTTEPLALVLVLVCAVAALHEVRAHSWRDPQARRSLAAPLLSPLGLGALAVFLWAWTGTPFAIYLAQHYGWHQQNQPLALLGLPVTKHLIGHPGQLLPHLIAWNIWNGVLGGVFLLVSIIVLVRVRRELSAGALTMAIGVAVVALWSILTPPNVRVALIAFPAILVWGRRLSGRAFELFVAAEVLLLGFTSALTFSGHMLP
ncbi:MAG TPA: mannosyltransferase family protein [Streptosporangiaceae bacterium]